MLENLQADIEQLGLDETELPEVKPIKFKHLSENIDLAKLKKMSVSFQSQTDAAPVNKVTVKLQHGNAHLMLPVLSGAEGTVVLQQAVQKCGGVGALDDFKLFLVVGDQERKLVPEKMIVFDIISPAGAGNCKLVLEKVVRHVSDLSSFSHTFVVQGKKTKIKSFLLFFFLLFFLSFRNP